MSKLEILIEELEKLVLSDSKVLHNFSFVKSMSKLISCLKEIKELIGLDSFKNLVVRQFKYFTRNVKETGSPLKGDMMNSIFFGPPGVGKTECGRHLAKFWECCGCIKKDDSHKNVNKRISLKLLNPPSSDDFILPGFLPQTPGKIETFKKMDLPVYLGSLVNLPSSKDDIPFNIYTRADFIGAYQGSSAVKTREIIEKNIGGVVMIDEAYSLIIDDKDTYGKEASTEILNFMDKYPDKIRWIFAGYKKEMKETLFSIQPGFERRFNWFIEIDPYTGNELSRIFIRQMKLRDWEYQENAEKIKDLFESHKNILTHYGGSTLKICYCLETIKTDESWELMLNDQEWTDRTFCLKDVEKALGEYKKMCIKADVNDFPYHLYV